MVHKTHHIEIWAQLELCADDQHRICDFFCSEIGLKKKDVVPNMHLTVYHSRRPMPGVTQTSEQAEVVIDAVDTRFMVMAPGGENPRNDLDPKKKKIGVRLHRQSPARLEILRYRNRLLQFETREVLGRRKPSTATRNAFGAQHYQPHMTLLRQGAGIDGDLKVIGAAFREAMGRLVFDRFTINIHQVR